MKEKKFEDMLSELETLVKKLESGDTDLDTSIRTYQKAMKLAKECGDKLNNAEEAVNKILSEDGTLKDFHIENVWHGDCYKIKEIDRSIYEQKISDNFFFFMSIVSIMYWTLKPKEDLYDAKWNVPDTTLAIMINGEISTTFSTTDIYPTTVECTNGTGTSEDPCVVE